MVDNELTQAASSLVGRPVAVEWRPMPHHNGYAWVTPAGWRVALNPGLLGDHAKAVGVALHEAAHLHCGHIMTPERFLATKQAPVTPGGRFADAGDVQRETEAWAQAASWANAAGLADVVDYCKRQAGAAPAEILIAEQLRAIERRLKRLERRYNITR